MAEVSRLRKENEALTVKTQELSKTLQSSEEESNRKIAELTKEKNSIESQLEKEKAALAALLLHNETFTLTSGQSRSFGKYDLTVGYVDYDSTSLIKVIFNNASTTMRVGTVLTAQTDGKTCQLILERFVFAASGSPATFSFVVRDK